MSPRTSPPRDNHGKAPAEQAAGERSGARLFVDLGVQHVGLAETLGPRPEGEPGVGMEPSEG